MNKPSEGRTGDSDGLKSRRSSGNPPPEEIAVSIETTSISFIRYDTREVGSLAQLAPALTDRCGIYILQFEDESEYVGQSTDVISRYANHRRTWGDIVAVLFTSCQVQELDDLELKVISARQKSHSVRNRKGAALPGGRGDVAIMVNDGPTVPLPWDRPRRVTIQETPSTTREARFWRLAQHPMYSSIRSLLQRYLRETVPAPVDSQGLWVLTALPTTGRGERLFTLSVGDTETMYGWQGNDDPPSLSLVLNVSDEDETLGGKLDACGLAMSHEPATYAVSNHHPVRHVACDDFPAASELLSQDYVLDAAYRLNVVLMRRGSAPFRRYHNQLFAGDVLSAAWRASGGANY